jgi:MFS transporter, Spinster family, sphingosine-1-phosphate transporter
MSNPSNPTPSTLNPRNALWLLLGINLFNYIDRQVLSAVLPKLELEASLFDPQDSWLQFKLGSLTSAFMFAYLIFSPIFGWLGDRYSRWKLVAIGVILWSLASGGSGLATSFVMLLITRAFVGIGEAAYGPVAPSMLSDLYPVERRGRVLSLFYMAIPVGSALGFVLGGYVAGTSLGWRGAFQVVVIPGLILGVLCFLHLEPPRKQAPVRQSFKEYLGVVKSLKNNRSFLMCSTGMICTTFVLGGMATWMPKYIFERQAQFQVREASFVELEKLKNSKGELLVPESVLDKLKPLENPEVMNIADLKLKLIATLSQEEMEQYAFRLYDPFLAEDSTSLTMVNVTFGMIIVVGGLIATLLGGLAGDWARKKGIKGAYFKVAGWTTILAWPLFAAVEFLDFPFAWFILFLSVLCMFFNTGPTNTILANVTRSNIRSTAFAVNILVIHLFGDAISPMIIGAIADVSTLGTALVIFSSLLGVGGLLWVLGAKYLDEDTERAEAA